MRKTISTLQIILSIMLVTVAAYKYAEEKRTNELHDERITATLRLTRQAIGQVHDQNDLMKMTYPFVNMNPQSKAKLLQIMSNNERIGRLLDSSYKIIER